MTTENGGAAELDRRHDTPLGRRQRGAMLLTIGFTVAAEDVRHFQLGTVHQPSGLVVEHTLLVAIRR